MKKFALSLFNVSVLAVLPVIANAAGTYYNGNLYQNRQYSGYGNGGYYNSYGAGARGQNQSMIVRNTETRVTKKSVAKGQNSQNTKQGLRLGAAFSHEFSNWDFEMKEAKSRLRYDNLRWNVISGEAAYYFGSETPMQIKVGGRYGVQFGESSMIDDDISNGAYGYEDYPNLGRLSGYAMSIGTSKDGVQYGFNAAFGLTDFFRLGNVKVTPSLGYRYFKHSLYTKNNSGLTMDVFDGVSSHPYVNCIEVGGETQCDPYVAFVDNSGALHVTGRVVLDSEGNLSEYIPVPDGVAIVGVSLGDTYYYNQSGTSHKYETEWYGPYVALDMEYEINSNNFVNAGIEFGLPMYDSKGDQPYRVDWAHPTSVEDKGAFGKAYHLGLNAMWSTALTDSTMLSLGMTYDYYNVKDAKATTYLNASYYESLSNIYQAIINAGGLTQDQINDYLAEIDGIAEYKAKGWKLETENEIKSVYSAMGIRLGLNVKF